MNEQFFGSAVCVISRALALRARGSRILRTPYIVVATYAPVKIISSRPSLYVSGGHDSDDLSVVAIILSQKFFTW